MAKHAWSAWLRCMASGLLLLRQSPQPTWQHVVPPKRAMQCSSATPTVLSLMQVPQSIFCLSAVVHWHGDHTWGLQQVVEAFPDAAVAMHELDAPYIVGGADARALKGDNIGSFAVRHMVTLPNSTAYP